MIIDAYAHVCPMPLLEAMQESHPTDEAMALTNSYLWDTQRRLRYMDKLGVDTHVLVLVRPPMWLGMDRQTLHRLTRLANDSIAAMAAAAPDRFIGVGVVPVADDQTIAEVSRARNDLGLRGMLIFSNIEGAPLDSPEMMPLYAEAERWNMPLWIHPQHGISYPWLKRDLLDRMFGWPFETTLAMARLAYGGVLERHPRLNFVTHHLGGMLPFYAERMEAMNEEVQRYRARSLTEASTASLSRPLTDYLRSFYGDTMVNGSQAALECGRSFFGIDHMVYGTDFPMGPDDGEKWPEQVLRSVQEFDASPSDRALVLSGNISRLLDL